MARHSSGIDPGSSTFGIYSQYPGFKNADNTIRTSYSEDALNTWDANANNRQHSPNEHLRLDHLYQGVRTTARLLLELGD